MSNGIALIVLTLLAFKLARTALAETTDVFKPFANYSVKYDDNVFGLPNGVSPINQYGVEERSDLSRTLSAGFALHKNIGRQNFTGDFLANKTTYDTLKTLNYNGSNLSGNWAWVIGSHVDGNLGATRYTGRPISGEFRQLANSTISQNKYHLDAGWRFHPDWRTRVAFLKSKTDYGLAIQQFADRDETIGEVEVDYLARSGSSIGLLVRHIEGNFPNPLQTSNGAVSSNYSQIESKVHVDWLATGKTRLKLLAGPVFRNQADPRVPDFQGFNARATADYKATGTLAVTSQLWRETAVVDDFSAAYSLNKGFSLEPRWQISGKTALKLRYQAEQRDFKQQTGRFQTFAESTVETSRNTAITLTYVANRAVVIDTVIFHSVRSSEKFLAAYTRNGVAINMRGEF